MRTDVPKYYMDENMTLSFRKIRKELTLSLDIDSVMLGNGYQCQDRKLLLLLSRTVRDCLVSSAEFTTAFDD